MKRFDSYISRLSIRKKLNAIVMTICTATLLLFMLFWLTVEFFTFKAEMLSNMFIFADVIAKNSSAAIVFHDESAAEENLASLATDPAIECGHIHTPDGTIFASYLKKKHVLSQEILELVASKTKGYKFTMHDVSVVVPIESDGATIGFLRIRRNLDKLWQKMLQYLFFSALIILAIVILAYFLSSRLQRIISTPVLHLADITARISREGAYSLRAAKENNDELGTLVDGFNAMLDQIESSHRKLNEHRQALAEKVRIRTAELEQSNQNLMGLNEKLRQAIAEAESANRAKSDFLANMSHELRTPMNHIIGFTELVADQHFGPLNSKQVEYLGDVLKSSHHLLNLINDILDLSKVEAGKMVLESGIIELSPLIESSISMVSEKALKAGLQLNTALEQLPPTIEADKRKIKQIMYNLLSNAVKFTPDGGEIRVHGEMLPDEAVSANASDADRTQTAEDQRYVKISVTDNGIGLKPESLQGIFRTFEQVEGSKSRKYQGTGLGLSLISRLVALHGGAIWAESPGEDKGATFSFILPLDDAQRQAIFDGSLQLPDCSPGAFSFEVLK